MTSYSKLPFRFQENRPHLWKIRNIFAGYMRQRIPITYSEWLELVDQKLSSIMRAQVRPIFETADVVARREASEEARKEAKAEAFVIAEAKLRKSIERFLLKGVLELQEIADGLDVPLLLVLTVRDEMLEAGISLPPLSLLEL